MEWIIVAILAALIIWAYVHQYKHREKNEYDRMADRLRNTGVPEKCIKSYIKELKKIN